MYRNPWFSTTTLFGVKKKKRESERDQKINLNPGTTKENSREIFFFLKSRNTGTPVHFNKEKEK